VSQAEAKANDAMQRLQTLTRERKDQETRALKRWRSSRAPQGGARPQGAAAAVGDQRLQTSVQEKAKALKVAELELQRYKGKGASGASIASAVASAVPEPAAAKGSTSRSQPPKKAPPASEPPVFTPIDEGIEPPWS